MFDLHSFLIVLTVAMVTAIIRFSPFVIFKNKLPKLVEYLSNVLPCAVIAMLVVYCVKDVSFSNGSFIPQFSAILITILIHKLKHNTLLSIVLGTACYMVLNQILN